MLFFERRKTERKEWPEVFAKDKFPQNVRTQCWQICDSRFNNHAEVIQVIQHAIGVYRLNDAGRKRDYMDSYSHSRELNHFFHYGLNGGDNKADTEYAFSVLELMCKDISKHGQNQNLVDAVNYRLRLGGVGYKFADDRLIRLMMSI